VTVVYHELETALAATLDGFLLDFARSLATLYHEKVIGSIEWTSDSMCQFEYALREVHSPQASRHEMRSHGLQSDRIVTTDIEDYVTSHWRIEHHLMRGSVSHQLGPAGETPPRALGLWQAIPTWLREQVAVVRGDLFRKQEIEIARWEDTVVRRSSREEVRVLVDPAITLAGQLVLTAWDEQELKRDIPAITLHSDQLAPQSFRGAVPLSEWDHQPEQQPAMTTTRHEQVSLLGLLTVPALMSLVCSLWFPGGFAVPVLAAFGVVVLWTYNLRGYAPVLNQQHQGSFQLLATCTGLLAGCSSLTAPYAIASRSLGMLALSMLAIVGAAVCWSWSQDLLEQPRH